MIRWYPIDPYITLQSTGDFFDYETNIATDYGDRSQGFLTAPETGNYVFWIASDDDGDLFLSSNSSPANAQLIASVFNGYTGDDQWNKYSSQISQPIALVQGHSYYLEVLHKQASGNDNVALGWQLPDGTLGQPMPLADDEPYDPANSTPSIAQAPQGYFHQRRQHRHIHGGCGADLPAPHLPMVQE